MSLTKVTRATTLIKDGWGAFNTLIDDLLSVASGKGASQIGVLDAAGNMDAVNVEGALAEIYTDHATTKALAETFDENPATTTGLVWGYKGGIFRLDSTVTTVSAGTIALTDDATNYIEIDPSDGLVKKNTTSFTSGRIPIRTVLTASGSQSTSTDKRAWFTQAAGATETTSGTVELATDAETITGTATDRAVTPANMVARAASVSSIATDPAWAAAGDLVQGTGNDTAAVLTAGTKGQVLQSGGAAAANTWVDKPNRNILINGDFRINQRVYVSAATLATTVYGHDRWKAGASGGDYSFTQLNGPTVITIAAGKTLIQVVEDKNVYGGTYTLSWEGTAQGRYAINSATPAGAYADSPIAITGQTAGTTMSVEFDDGTLGEVQLELGSVATAFEYRDIGTELAMCQRYYYRVVATGDNTLLGAAYSVLNNIAACPVNFPVPLRTPPTGIEMSGLQDFKTQDIGAAMSNSTANTTLEAGPTTTMAYLKVTTANITAPRATGVFFLPVGYIGFTGAEL
jgi:hypothetical protein